MMKYLLGIGLLAVLTDRKSTRLNSSHLVISYAVFCLKKKDTLTREQRPFVPLDAKNVRIYVCGPTVYDFAHICNARPVFLFFFFNDTATPEIYTLSLHYALPIYARRFDSLGPVESLPDDHLQFTPA